MKKNGTAWSRAAVVFAVFAIALVLIFMPPLTDCRSQVPVAAGQHWFRAIQTVVQPWSGPHHVYGVFAVPIEYRRHRLYRARLKIEGFTEEFPETSPEAGGMYDSRVKPGHYRMRVNLPTRVALWFLLTGRFGQLRTACHWWLIIEDRVR